MGMSGVYLRKEQETINELRAQVRELEDKNTSLLRRYELMRGWMEDNYATHGGVSEIERKKVKSLWANFIEDEQVAEQWDKDDA